MRKINVKAHLPALLLAGIFCLTDCAFAIENHLKDPEFQQKNGPWEVCIAGLGKNSKFKKLESKNGFRFQIEHPVLSGYIQLHQKPVVVPASAECFFSFDLDAEHGAAINWFTVKMLNGPFLYHKSSPVKKGKQHFEFSFFTPSSSSGTVSLDVYFSIAALKGENRISNPKILAVRKKDTIPYCLPSEWTLEKDRETSRIGFSEPVKFPKKTTAVFSNEFDSPKSGMMCLGISAAGSFKVKFNDALLYEAEKSSGGWKDRLNGQRIYLPVVSGKNRLKIEFEGTRIICGDPGVPFQFCADTGYRKIINDNDLYVKAGSALDLSDIYDNIRTSGRPVVNADGEYVYEKSGKEVRLFGADGGVIQGIFKIKDRKKFEKNVTEYIDAFRRQGYNYIRIWGSVVMLCDKPGKLSVSEEWLDRMHFTLEQMSRKGIYVNWLVLGPRLYGTEREQYNKSRAIHCNRMLGYLQDPEIMKHWQFGISLLTHEKNGKKLMDYPCILSVECFNEQYAGLALLRGLRYSYPKAYEKMVQAWNSYLSEKYKKEIKNEPIPFTKGKYRNDFALFQEKLVTDLNLRYLKDLREIGWKGMVFQNNYRNLLYSSATWKTMPGVNDHTYFNHPSSYWDIGSICRSNSSISAGLNYLRDITSAAFAGRPVFVGEVNHSFWNPYLYECGAAWGAFSALQGFGGYNFFSRNVVKNPHTGWNMLENFSIAANPVGNANAFLQAHLYGRGDVKRSPHIVTLQIPDSFLEKDANALLAPSAQQSLLSLVARYTIGYPDRSLPKGSGLGRKADLELTPSGLADITAHGWFASVNDTKDQKFSLEKAVEELRRRNVLSSRNRTDVKQGIFESDTEEILLRRKEKQLLIRTPRTEVFVSPAGKSEKLGALSVLGSSEDCCFAAVSRDGKDLSASRHIVLVYTTEAGNSDMRLSEDRQMMLFPGFAPTLLKTGKVTAELRNDSANLVCYALSLNGTRMEKIPLKKENGVWHIEIDTAKLKQEPSVYFELIEE